MISCLSCYGTGSRTPTVVDLNPGGTYRVLETHCIECDGTCDALCYECGYRFAVTVRYSKSKYTGTIYGSPVCRTCVKVVDRRRAMKRRRRNSKGGR